MSVARTITNTVLVNALESFYHLHVAPNVAFILTKECNTYHFTLFFRKKVLFNISTTASVSNRIIIDLFLFRIDHKVMVFFLYLCSYPLDHLVMIKISKEHQKPPLKHAPFSLYFSREIKIGKATDIFICQAKNSLGGISILSVSFQVC